MSKIDIMEKTIWNLDPMHSEVQFKVKHLVISTVTGEFGVFNASLQSNGLDFSQASAQFEADVDSINTRQTDRDNHLKSADFFDAAQFPKLTFETTSFEHIGGDRYTIHGNITIKGVTKPIALSAVYGGNMTDFYGNDKVGFEMEGKINRQDFGLTWSAVTEAGGIVVSDEVKLILNLQFAKQQ